MHGIKALRECSNAVIRGCDIISPEFGWSVRGIRMEDTRAVSEYFMMRSENLTFREVTFQGKYSFQYIKNAVFENCTFDTKDAFWHGEMHASTSDFSKHRSVPYISQFMSFKFLQ